MESIAFLSKGFLLKVVITAENKGGISVFGPFQQFPAARAFLFSLVLLAFDHLGWFFRDGFSDLNFIFTLFLCHKNITNDQMIRGNVTRAPANYLIAIEVLPVAISFITSRSLSSPTPRKSSRYGGRFL